MGGGILAANDLARERNDMITIGDADFANVSSVKADDGTIYPIQRYINLDGEKTAAFAPKLPSLGWQRFSASNTVVQQKSPFIYNNSALETPFYRIAFDKAGRITSLIIKESSGFPKT
jgi:alpha-mannosidase